ncbi:type II toxin-antitoxin system RelE/ParE family toxin [Erwinia pyri]|uniref:Type II toxin-antitoxin system RelE/ParE family toxin n=1 Tax=Erwinia pyri TaxID=3062598 RepID=A0AA50DN84_9GAMM|nr:type II toxin-antitoxin system RelE/ParE family toxin [Erwinia sp. DE2]WLS79110.1 type II toxin-antitoxin system RelE/ParE family toxin [Erwinia sp. DE2]
MRFIWADPAIKDLERVYQFLAKVNPRAAANAVQALVNAPTSLITHPRHGPVLSEFEPREVRRLIVGQYEIRYELKDEEIYLLRVWHSKEDR